MHGMEKCYFVLNLLPDEFSGCSLVLQLWDTVTKHFLARSFLI